MLDIGSRKTEGTVHGRSALMLRTGVVVVRSTTPGFGVVEFDCQGGVGDRDADGLPGVGSAQSHP